VGLSVTLERFGPEGCATWNATLDGADEWVVAESGGRGIGRQSLASVLFEAIEHYHLSVASQIKAGALTEIRFLQAAAVAAQPQLRRDRVVHKLGATGPEQRLPCARFSRVEAEGETLWYPLFLNDPTYHLRPIPGDELAHASFLRYSSGSGAAAGVSLAEALVHGILELVERDGTSLSFIDWFVTRRKGPRIVSRALLPPALRSLVSQVDEEMGGETLVVETTTDLGIPSFLATTKERNLASHPFGAGASPVAAYAIERALSELLQFKRLGSAVRQAADRDRVLRQVGRWPPLVRCVEFDIPELLQRGGSSRVASLDSDFEGLRDAGVDDCLRRLLTTLRAKGLDCYYRPITAPDAEAVCVLVLIPGIERFEMVRRSGPITPTGRGWDRWPRRAPGFPSGWRDPSDWRAGSRRP
jgi:ribosomal protein S12 methylthiotransferase accessory factor